MLEPIAAGVASAHRHGLVHGRLRPQNVLFDDDGNAYVADLGLDEICAGVVTFAATAYDAPERLGGLVATPVADVYSLGVLLHQLLTGATPPLDSLLAPGDHAAAGRSTRVVDPNPATGERRGAGRRGARRSEPGSGTTALRSGANPYRTGCVRAGRRRRLLRRDEAVEEMLAVLATERLLVVVGPSGIGKSSAVKAGLLPALNGGAIAGSETWLFAEMTPERGPLEQLAAALERLAVVDLDDVAGELAAGCRLDEIVAAASRPTPCSPSSSTSWRSCSPRPPTSAIAAVFLDLLADVATRRQASVRVAATLRADYFDRPLAYAGFSAALRGRTIVLGAMTSVELAEAVRRPAHAVGVEVDAGLVERITGEAEGQPGACRVQYVLADMFQSRRTNELTLVDFDVSGGLDTALGKRAERIYAGLDPTGQEQTRRLFLNLVNVSVDHADTRRRARLSELEQEGLRGEELGAVLGEFGATAC